MNEVNTEVPEAVASRRILVVDDQEFIREILAFYLEEDRHHVELASSATEALSKFTSNRFDLVITDQDMPEMKGSQLVGEIKRRAPGQRVIVITGYGADAEIAESMGADAVLGKPISQEALRKAIAG